MEHQHPLMNGITLCLLSLADDKLTETNHESSIKCLPGRPGFAKCAFPLRRLRARRLVPSTYVSNLTLVCLLQRKVGRNLGVSQFRHLKQVARAFRKTFNMHRQNEVRALDFNQPGTDKN